MAGDAAEYRDFRGSFWSIWPIRLLVLFIVMTMAYAGVQLLILKGPPLVAGVPQAEAQLGAAAVGCAALILLYRLLIRFTEKRWPGELGARRSVPHFIEGAIIGVLLFCAVYAVLFALHVARFAGVGGTQGLAVMGAMSLASGVGEEILMRGVVFRLIEDGMGTLAALIASAALFGALHLGNPHANLIAGAAIALEAGILLAAAYALTRTLWLAIGLHAAWNFTEGGIFGAAVSGGSAKGLLKVPLTGPDWLTGGAFGPEASVAAVCVCTALAIVMLTLAIRRGHWQRIALRLRA